MQYFEQDYIDFFNDLAKNNNKEWFHSNKNRYESSVKKPFIKFLTHLIELIQQHRPDITISPKDCIARINRDIRFSKNKEPYNLHNTAFISKGGKKDKTIPGIYLKFGAEELGIMAGCYTLSKEQLLGVRKEIQLSLSDFQKLYKNKELLDAFGSIRGEANKRIPLEFKDTFKEEALIANKQFYIATLKDSSLLLQDNLLETVMKHWHIANPLNNFLEQSIKIYS